jgi:hypothetical protein
MLNKNSKLLVGIIALSLSACQGGGAAATSSNDVALAPTTNGTNTGNTGTGGSSPSPSPSPSVSPSPSPSASGASFSITSISPTSGQATQVVTITGAGFASGATVTINSVNCPATFVSATQLTCVAPTNLDGLYNLIVTQSSQSLTASSQFHYATITQLFKTSALMSDGTVETFGPGYYSAATTPTTIIPDQAGDHTPRLILNSDGTPLSHMTKISTYSDGAIMYGCGLNTSGNIICWGDNSLGQLGQGNTTAYANPVKVSFGGSVVSGAVDVSVTTDYGCAALGGIGNAICWGSLDGNGGGYPLPVANADYATYGPAHVVIDGTTLINSVNKVSVGGFTQCFLRGGTNLQCFGFSNSTATPSTTATNVSLPYNQSSIINFSISDDDVVCVAYNYTNGGGGQDVACWSGDTVGFFLGNGAVQVTPASRYTTSTGASPHLTQVQSENSAICVLLSNGQVSCEGSYHVLADGSTSDSYTSFQTVLDSAGSAPLTGVTQLGGYTCSLIGNNQVQCWGAAEGNVNESGSGSQFTGVNYPVVVASFE